MQAILALEDGRIFRGKGYGAEGEVTGRLFQHLDDRLPEILDRPKLSVVRWLRLDVHPQIGNYGINPDEDVESRKPHLAGFVVRENSPPGRDQLPAPTVIVDGYLKRWGIVGLEGIDTRRTGTSAANPGGHERRPLVGRLDDARLMAKAKASPGLVGRDLVREVS